MRPENQSTTNYTLPFDHVWKEHRPSWNDGHLNFQLIRTVKPTGKDGPETKGEHGLSQTPTDLHGRPDVGTGKSGRGLPQSTTLREERDKVISFHQTEHQARY